MEMYTDAMGDHRCGRCNGIVTKSKTMSFEEYRDISQDCLHCPDRYISCTSCTVYEEFKRIGITTYECTICGATTEVKHDK